MYEFNLAAKLLGSCLFLKEIKVSIRLCCLHETLSIATVEIDNGVDADNPYLFCNVVLNNAV